MFLFLPSATRQRQFHTPSKNQSTNLHANLKPIEKPPIYTQVKINFPGPSPIKILFCASFVAACRLQQTVNFWVSYSSVHSNSILHHHSFDWAPYNISGAVLRLHRIMVAPPNNKLPIIIIDNPIHSRMAEIKEAPYSIFCSEL